MDDKKHYKEGDTVDFSETRPDSNKSGRFSVRISKGNKAKYDKDLQDGKIKINGVNTKQESDSEANLRKHFPNKSKQLEHKSDAF